MSQTKVFVFSGAAGAGKSTVLKRIMSERDDLRFSVSATTRAPRDKEVDGVDYFFVTREKFQEMIANNELLEYDEHHENFYGTPRSQMTGKCVILDVEPNGAFQVRKNYPDATLIFITPPSMEVLEQRLRNRGDTSEHQIQIRLERAKWEIEQSKHYDHVVINDDLDACIEQVRRIMDLDN